MFDKRFTTKDDLNVHRRMHTEETSIHAVNVSKVLPLSVDCDVTGIFTSVDTSAQNVENVIRIVTG